jgi:hypothetical protein
VPQPVDCTACSKDESTKHKSGVGSDEHGKNVRCRSRSMALHAANAAAPQVRGQFKRTRNSDGLAVPLHREGCQVPQPVDGTGRSKHIHKCGSMLSAG